MAANALQKITARVKKLRKQFPNKKYVDLQKQASAQLKREGTIGKVKKTPAKPKNTSVKKVRIKFKKNSMPAVTIGRHKRRVGETPGEIQQELNYLMEEQNNLDNKIEQIEEMLCHGGGVSGRGKKTSISKVFKKPVKAKVKKKVGSAQESNDLRTKLRRQGKKLTHGYEVVTAAHKLSGINHTKVGQELKHKAALEQAMHKHQSLLKQKGLKPAEKAAIRNDIKKYRDSVAVTKRHISELKRGI